MDSYLMYVGKVDAKSWVYLRVEPDTASEYSNIMRLCDNPLKVYGDRLWSKQKPGYIFPCSFDESGSVSYKIKAESMSYIYCLNEEGVAEFNKQLIKCKAYITQVATTKKVNEFTDMNNMTVSDFKKAYRGLPRRARTIVLAELINLITQ